MEMVGCYLAFSSLALLSKPLKPLIGEFADVLMMTAYFWPYPIFMALQTWPVFEVEKAVGAFVAMRRPAPPIRPKLDIGFRVSGQSVELFEIRPQWNRPSVKRESAVAKATFVRTQGIWKVFWKRADLKWHPYEPVPEVAAIDKFLAVVQEDEYGCFWG